MKSILIYIWLLALSGYAYGQEQHVRACLRDAQSGEPIAGAVININQKLLLSDDQGCFFIPVSNENTIELQITHIGYEPVTRFIKLPADQESLNIKLKSSVRLLEEVLISTDQRPSVSQKKFDRETVLKNNPKNIGDIFGDKEGFGIVKRGGYAMEPVFRSFKYEQLNLIFDGGTYITNACPNRMDPASTQISPAEIDRIELVKGPFSVRYGQTMGGLINIITNRPEYVDKFRIAGELEGGYEFNGNGITGRGSLMAVGKKMDLSLQGGGLVFDDYLNGDGEEIPSSFQTYNYAVKVGVNPATNHRVQVNWRQSFGKDIDHVSLPMDSPKDNSSVMSVDYGARNLTRKLSSINAKTYYTFVDHLMTNENRPNFRMTEASSPVTSETFGGRLELGLELGSGSSLFLGTDLRHVAKDGVRNRKVKMMNGMVLDPPREFTDLIWQDSWLYSTGIFGEATIYVNEKWDLVAGIRTDYITSNANNPSPDFAELYGGIEQKSEVNFSMHSSANLSYGKHGLFQVSLGRGQRAADLLERYINHFNVGLDAYEYVGNPDLNSEINNQIDLTLKNGTGNLHWKINVFYSYINNYISAVVDNTLPRKYMPGTEPIYSKRFVNLDQVWQTGFDASLHYQFTTELSVNAGGYYTYAQNIDFDEPLAEIPPLTGTASLHFKKEKYQLEFTGRFVARQERVADSFDEATSPGFSVFNILGSYNVVKNLDLNLAFRNIFNANYFEHLSRPYQNQTENGMLYEPGRSLRIGARLKF